MPAGRKVIFGCWEDRSFIGVIIYSKGVNNNMTKFFNLKHTQICELTRIAFDKHKEAVSKFIAVSLKLLKRMCPGLKVIFSYADKDQNHSGAIYKASNFTYLGGNYGQTYHFIINGKKRHSRSVNQIMHQKYNVKSNLENIRKYLDKSAVKYFPKGKHLFTYCIDRSLENFIRTKAAIA
jgi:hypothetical protein